MSKKSVKKKEKQSRNVFYFLYCKRRVYFSVLLILLGICFLLLVSVPDTGIFGYLNFGSDASGGLFEVETMLIREKVSPGERIEAKINILNLGDNRPIDILLRYEVRDLENETLLFREESVAINENLNIERGLYVDEDFDYGDYIFYANISFGGVGVETFNNFTIIEGEVFLSPDETSVSSGKAESGSGGEVMVFGTFLFVAVLALAVVLLLYSALIVYFKKSPQIIAQQK